MILKSTQKLAHLENLYNFYSLYIFFQLFFTSVLLIYISFDVKSKQDN